LSTKTAFSFLPLSFCNKFLRNYVNNNMYSVHCTDLGSKDNIPMTIFSIVVYGNNHSEFVFVRTIVKRRMVAFRAIKWKSN
jgi:hypothetical protein